MKLSQLKTIVKEAVKEAIQEEMKDLLMEAVRAPRQTFYENRMGTPTTDVAAPIPGPMNPVATKSREEIREGYKNILGETAATFNSSMVGKPLQMSGPVDTISPNGSLPAGEVSMDQIMGLMKK
jgi:hypothetical protein